MRINQLLNVPSQYYQPNQLETKMRTLIKLPIFLALMLVIFCCLLSSAHAIEPDYIGVSGRVQDMQRVNWVKAHSHTRERQYVFNDIDSISDREFPTSCSETGR